MQVKIALAPDGAELAWAEEGEGEPLLLIAGQATGMAGWGPTAQALAHHFRVIRYDHRGIGGSGNGGSDRYTTRLLAADAAAVLLAAGVDAAHVYGHSMGGRIAPNGSRSTTPAACERYSLRQRAEGTEPGERAIPPP